MESLSKITRYKIVCVNKDKEDDITHVGFYFDGKLIRTTLEKTIQLIEDGHKFYTEVSDNEANVKVMIHPTSKKKFLKSEPDGTTINNLDNLTICPVD